MNYSIDLRLRVVGFIKGGGSKVDAAKIYKISLRTVFYWLSREDINPTKVTTRNRKIDKQKLVKFVENNPNTNLSECAKKFGVSIPAISKAFKKLKIIKKTDALQGASVYKKV